LYLNHFRRHIMAKEKKQKKTLDEALRELKIKIDDEAAEK